jgi:hypothetical protein
MRLFRLIPLLILVALVGGAWWSWRRIHRSEAASVSAAQAAVRKSHVAAAGVPRPGVYRYTATGHERIGVGPLTVSRTFPSQALLVVRPLGVAVRDVEWQLSADHVESWQTVSGVAGVRGTSRTLKVGTLGFSQSVSGAAQPAPLLYPRKLKPNQSWDSTYHVSGIVFLRANKVVAEQTLTVAGAAQRVFEIQTKETITGSLHGTDSFTQWYSPTLGIPVKLVWQRDLDGTIVNVLASTLTLTSVAPG